MMLASMFGLGFLHGLGLDHLMAIAVLVRKGASFRSAVAAGIRFGAGHMGVLAAAAVASMALRFTVPERFEAAMEVGGGLLLLMLGVWVLLDLRRAQPDSSVAPEPAPPKRSLGADGQWVWHSHAHDHGSRGHRHWHLHKGAVQEHTHTHLAWGLGGVFALSGVRSLLVMVPVVMAPKISLALAYIVLFGLGIVAAMSLFGIAVAQAYRFTSGSRAMDRWAGALTGLASLGMGAYWIAR